MPKEKCQRFHIARIWLESFLFNIKSGLPRITCVAFLFTRLIRRFRAICEILFQDDQHVIKCVRFKIVHNVLTEINRKLHDARCRLQVALTEMRNDNIALLLYKKKKKSYTRIWVLQYKIALSGVSLSIE